MATAGDVPGSNHDDKDDHDGIEEVQRPASRTGGRLPDCSHLDEDPEALEDPVHCGDARHQRDLHEQAKRQRP